MEGKINFLALSDIEESRRLHFNEEEIETFIPGRLCILGEHTDWAG